MPKSLLLTTIGCFGIGGLLLAGSRAISDSLIARMLRIDEYPAIWAASLLGIGVMLVFLWVVLKIAWRKPPAGPVRGEDH